MRLSLDGELVDPERVAVGRDGEPPPGVPFALEDEALWLPPRALLDRLSDAPRIAVGRVIETRGLASGRVDPELRRQLEELGYIFE